MKVGAPPTEYAGVERAGIPIPAELLHVAEDIKFAIGELAAVQNPLRLAHGREDPALSG